jgi:alpha-1,3-rhamnosyl/mannosyltransferase
MVGHAPDDEFLFFVDQRAHECFDLEGDNVRVELVELKESPVFAAAAHRSRRLSDMLRLTRAVRRQKPDVFFSPSVYSYFPLPPGQRAVVAIHDVIADRYPHLTLPTARARLFWKLKVGLALQQAKLILTVSDYSARAIHEFLGVPRSNIRVAAEAPAEVYRPSDEHEIRTVAKELGLPDGARWFVYVGGFNPHKRVTSLVWAHARVVAEERDSAPYLLLVGDPGSDAFFKNTDRIKEVIEEAGTAHKVLWTGFVPDDELRHVHSGALALVLPSEAEGFGLPAVEAAACGTPVIATNQSPLPELLKGGGIFVAPGDQETLEGALRLLSKDEALRARMGGHALDGARALSWETGARAALAAIREVAA